MALVDSMYRPGSRDQPVLRLVLGGQKVDVVPMWVAIQSLPGQQMQYAPCSSSVLGLLTLGPASEVVFDLVQSLLGQLTQYCRLERTCCLTTPTYVFVPAAASQDLELLATAGNGCMISHLQHPALSLSALDLSG